MERTVILFLMSPWGGAVKAWRERASEYPSVEAIILDDPKGVFTHPKFCKVTIIVYSTEWEEFKNLPPELTKEKVCKALPNLQWIHIWSGGIDHVLEFLKTIPPTIHITSNKGAYSRSIAEYVMGIILYFDRNIPQLVKNKEEKKYATCVMSSLEGKTLLLLGCGDIGSAIALMAKNAFDMKVVAVKRQKLPGPPPDFIDKLIIFNDDARASLQAFRDADYVVNTLPATSETFYFCSGREFKAMKKSAVFINVGRGSTVDEVALMRALNTRSIRGAALDKFQDSSLSEKSAWWNIDNLLISNHYSAAGQDSKKRGFDLFLKNLNRFMEDGSVETPVNMLYEY